MSQPNPPPDKHAAATRAIADAIMAPTGKDATIAINTAINIFANFTPEEAIQWDEASAHKFARDLLAAQLEIAIQAKALRKDLFPGGTK